MSKINDDDDDDERSQCVNSGDNVLFSEPPWQCRLPGWLVYKLHHTYTWYIRICQRLQLLHNAQFSTSSQSSHTKNKLATRFIDWFTYLLTYMSVNNFGRPESLPDSGTAHTASYLVSALTGKTCKCEKYDTH